MNLNTHGLLRYKRKDILGCVKLEENHIMFQENNGYLMGLNCLSYRFQTYEIIKTLSNWLHQKAILLSL